MGDLSQIESTQYVSIADETSGYTADVQLGEDSVKRLVVDARLVPRPIAGLFISQFEDSGGSIALNANGSNIPIKFEIPTTNFDRAINKISIYGRDAGIKFGQFLAINQVLQNGLIIEIKSNDNVFTSLPITQTDDFRNLFCISPRDFTIDVFSNEDVFNATFVSPEPIIIRANTQFTTPDYVRITVRDNLNNVNYLEANVIGGSIWVFQCHRLMVI